MNKRLLLSALGAASLFVASASASAQVRVAPRFNAELELVPRFTLEVGNRFVNGARIEQPGREQVYVGAQYDVLRWLSFSANYRFGMEQYHRAIWTSHRIATDAGLALRWNGFRFSYRLRWRNRWRPSQRVMTYDSTLRHRLMVRYHLPKPVFLSVSGELFTQMLPYVIGADTFRFEAEITGRVKPVDIAFGYRYQMPILGYGQSYHMVMATVTWHWDRARATRTPEERARRRRERDEHRDGRRHRRDGHNDSPSSSDTSRDERNEQRNNSANDDTSNGSNNEDSSGGSLR